MSELMDSFAATTGITIGSADAPVVAAWIEAQIADAYRRGQEDMRERAAAVARSVRLAGDPSVAELHGRMPAPPAQAATHRHKKRGTEYQVLGEATIQTEKPLTDYAVVTVYRDVDSGRLWCRPPSEFHDGRFEALPAPPAQEVK